MPRSSKGSPRRTARTSRRSVAGRSRPASPPSAADEAEPDAPAYEDDGFIQLGDGEDWPAQFGAARLAIP